MARASFPIRSAAWTLALAALASLAAGCDNAATQTVPYPISLTLPHTIRIHSFTTTKIFSPKEKGIEVHIEALDAYGDPTKAFGDFRFSLYAFKKQSPDPRGKLVSVWSKSVLTPENNALHWSGVSRTYVFKLDCTQDLPGGQQFVLEAEFSSPYSERKFDSKTITAWK